MNATLLGPDPSPARSPGSKSQPGKDGIKYGTSRFDNTLFLRDHLIDEFRFWIMPIIASFGNGCSRTWTPPGSTSGSPTRGGWRTGR